MKRPLCCACAVFVATVFIYLTLNPITYNDFDAYEGMQINVAGEVTNKEYKKDKLIIYLNNIRILNKGYVQEDVQAEDLGQLILYTEYGADYTAPRIGSLIWVEGKLSYFDEPRNPGEFNSKLYYKILGIDAKLYKTQILKVGNTCNLYKETLYNIRRYFEKIYDGILNEKDASIMKAMVLGNKTELDYESKQLFQNSGIAHVFAISGLHITLLGMGIYKLLKRIKLPKWLCCLLPICLMLLYGDMVGMGSSAVRAIVMFGLKLFSKLIKRTYDMVTAVGIAAVLILVEQPLYIYHSGYMLSFGAVVGISCLLEVVAAFKIDGGLSLVEKLNASIMGSLSIFLVHFPIMLCVYYEFPVYSFLLNLVIIPAMTLVMLLGVAILVAGAIPFVLTVGVANLAGLVCHCMLCVFDILCKGSLKLAGARWIVGRPSMFRICVYAIAIIYLYAAHNYGVKISKGRACFEAGVRVMLPKGLRYITIILAVAFISGRDVGTSSINFIDVGQGDSIYVEGRGGGGFLIDAGSSSNSEVAKYTIVPYLKYRGVSRLDGVFLTHLDSDHISGVMDMLSQDGVLDYNIDIGKLCISDAVIEDDSYDKLVELCSRKNIPIYRLKAGDVVGYGDVKFKVLHPAIGYVPNSKNAYSLVMEVSIGDGKGGVVKSLLTGDVSEDGENLVADYLNGDIDIYKAAHHGSKNSNKTAIINAAMPRLTVISCGEGNRYGHPHSEAVDNFKNVGSDVIATKDTGAISIKIKNNDFEVDTYLNSNGY